MVAPSKFAHVVYNTHRYEEMIDWYLKVFEARIQHRDDRLAFLTYDDEHHRFAFLNLGPMPPGGLPARIGNEVGVNHLAYTWNGLGELVGTYKRLKAMGVTPFRPIRHGLTLSMYYRDPDHNGLEFQIDLMDAALANDFMAGEAFAANPVGEPFDPDALAARYESGRPVDDLIFRSDQPESAAATPIAAMDATTKARFGASPSGRA
ncbi:MAG: VOC family protein [Rhodospirillales bacterium]|nr:MAG: VOC family protein [Rhodospirillales bacterium]